MIDLTVAMLVRNPPLDRVATLVDFLIAYFGASHIEFVIVDTGSSPEGVATMSELSNTRVIVKEWPDDFSKARNWGLAEAKGRWTLVLDPDEMPSPQMLRYIEQVVGGGADFARPKALGYLFDTTNYWGGKLGPHEEYHWHLRLFKTGYGRFYRPVHELVELKIERAGHTMWLPEHVTRGTEYLPKADPRAYLIHSKPADEIVKADELYARLGEESR